MEPDYEKFGLAAFIASVVLAVLSLLGVILAG